jgi:trk system potassium uptake protein TrkA
VQDQLDVLVVTGNGASPRVLEELEAAKADLLLAVTDSDEVNLLAAAAGHRLGAARTLARVRDSDYVDEEGGFLRDVLGVDALLDPDRAVADDLAETLLVAGAVHVEHFAKGRLAFAEVIVHEHSTLVDTVVAERERAQPHSVVGVLRDGEAKIPAARERLRQGDHIFIAAASEQVVDVLHSFDTRAQRARDVVVFGGGRIGLRLAHRLEDSHIDVKLFERDEDQARHCAEQLPNTVVLHEGTLSKEVLLAHGVNLADAFVACGEDDRSNLLAGLHAKRLGVPLCLAIVSSEEFVPLVDALGVDAAFSLRLTTAEAILRFVRADVVRALHLTLSGAEVLDLEADPGAPIVGAPAASVDRLAGCEIGAILRGDDVVIPENGEERIEAGDRVLLFRLRGAAPDVEQAFDA